MIAGRVIGSVKMAEVAKAVEVAKALTLKQAERALLEASKTGDVGKIRMASKAVDAAEAREVAEAKAKARAQWEAQAVARGELTVKVLDAMKIVSTQFLPEIVKLVGKELAIIKFVATPEGSFDCKIIKAEPAPIKGARVSGGGGKHSTLKEFGKGLDQVYEEFATAEDRAKFELAGSKGSQWNVKVGVKKRAIAEGLLLPIS